MENTILAGDYCIGFKSIYGPKIPFTNIKFPILSTPHRGNIVIFKNSVFNGMSMIKRCVAVSGDTIKLINKNLYVNNSKSVYENKTKHIDSRILDFRDNFKEIIIPKKGDILSFSSFDIHKFEIEKNLFIDLYGGDNIEIKRKIIIDSIPISNYKFKTYNLPNITSISLSEKIVKYSELYDYIDLIKSDISASNPAKANVRIEQILFKNGVKIKKFKVYENCYFMMGDNRDVSDDSRYWGFITDKNLVAIPLFIYYSFCNFPSNSSSNGIRWDRIGKILF